MKRMNIIEVRSRLDAKVRYLFEGEKNPVRFNDGSVVERTLELGTHFLLTMAQDDVRNVMDDCEHEELCGAYQNSWEAVEAVLKEKGMDIESYRIHRVRNERLVKV